MNPNPFFELYVGERVSPREFVTIFSPFLVPHSGPLFHPGNVVVTGMQGAGKSMLLSLLKTETRLQYRRADEEFPVPATMRRFIGAGINLAQSNAIDFGFRDQRSHEPPEVELLFGDFLNYLILDDLLKSLGAYAGSEQSLRDEVGLNASQARLDEFARKLALHDVWEGWIGNVEGVSSLQDRLRERIRIYRRYLHRKIDTLPSNFSATKTSIGEPLSEAASILQDEEYVDHTTNFFINIDQYEELANISTDATSNYQVDYRAVINRALARRDQRVSYRIGSRGHSWRRHSKIIGSAARLEEERDYKYVDLDLILRRQENRSSYIFPAFAHDVFNRRLSAAGIASGTGSELLRRVYGSDMTPEQKVKARLPNSPERGLELEQNWKAHTKARLNALAQKDLVSAKLGEVWLRQKGDTDELDVRDGDLPWMKNQYWKKERRELAMFHVLARLKQRALWAGPDEITELSGGNILVFISINQFIWDAWIRYQSIRGEGDAPGIPSISIDLQSIGIINASEHWYEKIALETGRSSERFAFVRELSRVLVQRLMADKRMSTPGANGISVKVDELESHPEIRDFLEELSDYGNLIMLNHTTKEKTREARKKWYFNPIFCPHLRMPYQRTKEPAYVSIKDVMKWLVEAGVTLQSIPTEAQLSLFESKS